MKQKSIAQCVQDFMKQVNSSAIGSVAAITPPGNRYEKHDSSAASRAKSSIKRLKEKIANNFKPITAYPSTEDRFFSPSGEFSPLHMYVIDKGKGLKKRKTILPILTSKQQVLDWYLKNSSLNNKSQRRVKHGAVAFVSNASYLKGASKMIQERAGSFIAGWVALFEKMKKPISKFTTSKAITNVKSNDLSSVEVTDESILGQNDAQYKNPGLTRYAQSLINQTYPKSIEFYKRKQMPYLIKDIQKNFELFSEQAKDIVCNLNI